MSKRDWKRNEKPCKPADKRVSQSQSSRYRMKDPATPREGVQKRIQESTAVAEPTDRKPELEEELEPPAPEVDAILQAAATSTSPAKEEPPCSEPKQIKADVRAEVNKWRPEKDPRRAFVNAPSQYVNIYPTEILRRLSREARSSQPMKRFTSGADTLVLEERASLKDGVVYKLTTTWTSKTKGRVFYDADNENS